jgi:hypothetical protein
MGQKPGWEVEVPGQVTYQTNCSCLEHSRAAPDPNAAFAQPVAATSGAQSISQLGSSKSRSSSSSAGGSRPRWQRFLWWAWGIEGGGDIRRCGSTAAVFWRRGLLDWKSGAARGFSASCDVLHSTLVAAHSHNSQFGTEPACLPGSLPEAET